MGVAVGGVDGIVDRKGEVAWVRFSASERRRSALTMTERERWTPGRMVKSRSDLSCGR